MVAKQSAFTLEEAVQCTPSLSHLLLRLKASQQYLACVKPLIGATLLPTICAGPIEETTWCLIVKGNAVAAKLRQMLPQLIEHLRAHGHPITSIRLRIVTK